MKIRLYRDTRKINKDCLDSWSLYFPYPSKMRKERQAFGFIIGCTPTQYGMIHCSGFEDTMRERPYLGKRVSVAITSEAFQTIFNSMEYYWNKAITKQTDKAWSDFNRLYQ